MRKALAVAGIVAAAATADAAKFRGVMDALQDKYPSSTAQGATFACLDGSATIAAAFVNDDYCDCADGSDEPGTAACSHVLRAAPATFQYQCVNDGFATQHFPHSRVNDGICDCCDGSDEFESGVQCENDCAARREREEAEARELEAKRKAGLAAKASMVMDAQAQQQALKDKVAEQQRIIAEAEPEIAAATKERDEAEATEKAEREEIHKKSLAEKVVWEAEQAEKKAAKEKEDAEAQAKDTVATEVESAADAADTAPLEAEGAAEPPVPPTKSCIGWRQTGGCKGDGPREDGQDKDCETRVEGGGSGYCECEDMATKEQVLYRFDCGHHPLTCQRVCDRDGSDAPQPGDEPEIAPAADAPPPEEPTFTVDDGSAHTTEAANKARERLRAAESSKTDAEQTVKDAETALKEDFGPDSIFLALKDKCFSGDEGHYTYEMCLFKEVRQMPKGQTYGGTTLGRWKSWGEQSYGAWGSSHDFAQMKFGDGDRCWGGPERTVAVRSVCGSENKITHVDEPSMCTYTMVFETPALCE